MQERQRLHNWALSPFASNHRFGGSRGPQPDSIIGPIQTSSLVKAFIHFPPITDYTRPLVFQPLPASEDMVQWASLSARRVELEI